MDSKTMIERLKWLALAGPHEMPPDWLAPNAWGQALAELATAALETITTQEEVIERHHEDMESVKRWKAEHLMDWRPIDEAPIPDHEHVPTYWHYPCLIQTEAGAVSAGFARYARHDNTRNPNVQEKRILRWYEGTPVRYGVITKAKYFMPLPQPRKD